MCFCKPYLLINVYVAVYLLASPLLSFSCLSPFSSLFLSLPVTCLCTIEHTLLHIFQNNYRSKDFTL
jgi:hypothetical protein